MVTTGKGTNARIPRPSEGRLKFRVQYPSGAQHEVELAGNVATVGRDPSSDLVLNDPKCSRRHAVIEAGAEGVIIRDSGSANGIYVNGNKTERSRIRDGDQVKLGDVVVTLLPEAIESTMVMDESELPPEADAAAREDPTHRNRTAPPALPQV